MQGRRADNPDTVLPEVGNGLNEFGKEEMAILKRIPAVLIVQDEQLRELLRYNLYLGGFEVITAADAAGGLEAVRETRPRVVLIDTQDWDEIVGLLRADSVVSDLPVMVFTDRRAIGDVEEIAEAGADDYIPKPFGAEMVAQLVREKLKECETRIKKAGKKRIPVVLIDDDAGLRRLVEFNLHRDGFEVYSAADGVTGVALVKRIKPAFVLLDIVMPGMDGLEVLSTLKYDSKTSGVPVIMLTGESTIGIIDRAYEIGASDYITKPIRGREFGNTIREKLKSLKAGKVKA